MTSNNFAHVRAAKTGRHIRFVSGLLLACLIAMIPLASTHAETEEGQQGIAAIVNDEIISTYDLMQRVKLVMVSSGIPNTAENLSRIRPQILRSLIDERLKMQEAKRANINVTQEEVDAAFVQIAQRSNMTQDQVVAFLEQGGVDKQALISQVSADIAWNRFVNQQFGGLISVGENEVDEVLRRMEEESGSPQYMVSEILLTYDSPAQEAEISTGAQRLVEQMRQGAPFDGVARQFSQSASAANGGDIGWVHTSELPAPVAEVVKNMSIHTISDPIPTTAGIYIVSLTGKQSGTGADPMRDQYKLMKILFPLAPNAPIDAVALRARQTKEFLAQKLTCETAPDLIKKYEGAKAEAPKSVIAGQLDPRLISAIGNLKAGETTPPQRSELGIEVVVVCEHIADVGGLPTREAIDNNLYSQQLSMMSRRHLRDLRRDAVIVIR